jgi:hypothetical protein
MLPLSRMPPTKCRARLLHLSEMTAALRPLYFPHSTCDALHMVEPCAPFAEMTAALRPLYFPHSTCDALQRSSPMLPLSRMRAPRCFSASAACSCDRRDVWYMVYSCYLFRFLSYYSMARVDVVTSAPCLSSRSTVSWSSQIRRAVCTSVVEADVSVWPRCFLAVCLQLCCVRSLIDIYFTI